MPDPVHDAEREQVRALAEDLRSELEALKLRSTLLGSPATPATEREPEVTPLPKVESLPR